MSSLYTQVRAFDAVARAGSFSRAAEILSLTQPAVTIQVKALEDRYGVQLLHRSGRGVTLTPLGEELFAISNQVASLEERVRETLSASADLQNATLRLAADGPHIVMGLFARFVERHPGVALSVAMGNSRFVRQELIDRRADLAILPGVSDHPQIHAEPLWTHRAVVIVAADHRWARRPFIRLDDLDGEPFIGREEGSMTQAIVNASLSAIEAKPRFVLTLGSREALCEAVAAGLGCGIVWELEVAGHSRLASVPIAPPGLQSIDYVACLKSESSRRIVRAFFQVARSVPADRSDLAALRAALGA